VSASVRTVARVTGYQLRDVLRSRTLLAYGAFFLLVTEALLRFSGGDARALLSLMSVVLWVVPLVTLIYGTVYLYNAREFTELLLAQPVGRGQLFAGLYLGLTLPLALGVVVGVGAPFVMTGVEEPAQRAALATLLAVAAALTAVFTAIAFCIALRFEDRLKGLGAAIAVWLAASVLYDGLVLLVVSAFADYPLERAVLGLTLANPLDLARVALMLRFDVSALMGYTGAVFQRFFGGAVGTSVVASALAIWIAAPVAAGVRLFRRKDF
jgi:Cu-processing system permease protein